MFARLITTNAPTQTQSSTVTKEPTSSSVNKTISLNPARPKKELNDTNKKENETEEDRLARKQAMTLKTSGKIPRWDLKEDLKKFLKHTIRTFAEDCGQTPKF